MGDPSFVSDDTSAKPRSWRRAGGAGSGALKPSRQPAVTLWCWPKSSHLC